VCVCVHVSAETLVIRNCGSGEKADSCLTGEEIGEVGSMQPVPGFNPVQMKDHIKEVCFCNSDHCNSKFSSTCR